MKISVIDSNIVDRIDFFVAELKRRGIYVYMDLLDYRQFRTADGVAQGLVLSLATAAAEVCRTARITCEAHINDARGVPEHLQLSASTGSCLC